MTHKELLQLVAGDWIRYQNRAYKFLSYVYEKDLSSSRLNVSGHGQNFFSHLKLCDCVRWEPQLGEICIFADANPIDVKSIEYRIDKYSNIFKSNVTPEIPLHKAKHGNIFKHVYPIDYASFLRN